ncbi:hypothetical protein MKW92_019464 [Papaver armeniacum]|nr:hypothetical protein MKW92_019464 [Papaver armeniacum]
MSSGDGPSLEGNTQIVTVPERPKHSLRSLPLAPSNVGNAIVRYKKVNPKDEDEDIEIKLRRILEQVPVRLSNTSGSSAGSGSGDFHQVCFLYSNSFLLFQNPRFCYTLERKEQDRLARMQVDYNKRKDLSDFIIRIEERMKATEERTAKLLLKRQKKKMKKQAKKSRLNPDAGEQQKDESYEDEDKSMMIFGEPEIPKHIFVPAGERGKGAIVL